MEGCSQDWLTGQTRSVTESQRSFCIGLPAPKPWRMENSGVNHLDLIDLL